MRANSQRNFDIHEGTDASTVMDIVILEHGHGLLQQCIQVTDRSLRPLRMSDTLIALKCQMDTSFRTYLKYFDYLIHLFTEGINTTDSEANQYLSPVHETSSTLSLQRNRASYFSMWIATKHTTRSLVSFGLSNGKVGGCQIHCSFDSLHDKRDSM
jgi:hypothetical protein